MFTEDVKEVQNLIDNYFEGLFFGDIVKLKLCFHENTYIYGNINNVDTIKSLKAYLENVKNRQSPKELNEDFEMKVISIDILGKTAMAKLHVPMLGYNYYDYLSLFKIDTHWKIVNKLFIHI